MLRDALNEIRLHPGRFVATLLAIAISVGFMAAILVGVRTEENSVQRSNVLPVSRADLVVTGYFSGENGEPLKTILATSGVAEAAAVGAVPSPLTKGELSAFFNVYTLPTESFRWAELAAGRWPSAKTDIVLSQDGAQKLGVSLGDKIEIGFVEGAPHLDVVGITNDAPSLYASTAYVAADVLDFAGDMWVVKTSDPGATKAALETALGSLGGYDVLVDTADHYRAQQLNTLTAQFDVFRNLLLAFAGIALLVGMIIIANTFTILVTQRRRQIGLLRAVGASTSQVGWRLVAEGAVLGIVGSLTGVLLGTGVAALAGLFTKSLYWGLVMPWGELILAVLAGVLATILSVIGPSVHAARVAPLEALQVVPTEAQAKRIGVARVVVCAVLAVIGLALLTQVLQQPDVGLLWAIPGGGLLALAILLAAPLYVPALLRLGGLVFGFAGPVVRLAAANASRNPRRASATAVALMLAVGLIVTLQVGVATARTTAMEAIDQQFPMDVTVSTREDPLPTDLAQRLRDSGGAKTVVEIESKQVEIDYRRLVIRDVNPAREEMGLPASGNVPDGVLYVNDTEASALPSEVELPGAGRVRVEALESMEWGKSAVSHDTFIKISEDATVSELWVKLTDRRSLTALNQIDSVLKHEPGLNVGGGAMAAGALTQVVDVVLIVLTALLGVAVLIALVGVGNTLGLSVLERQRESALLRALGMQRGALRLMLLVEAMLLGIVGVGVGIVGGAAMGWLGIISAFGMIPGDERPEVVFSVDVLYTGGLILVCLVAAGLASVLPGRKAANATPTEALAVE